MNSNKELNRIRAIITLANEYAGRRWSEWGTRAEVVGALLDFALYNTIEDKEVEELLRERNLL